MALDFAIDRKVGAAHIAITGFMSGDDFGCTPVILEQAPWVPDQDGIPRQELDWQDPALS
jgi:hypothetical protein